MTCIVGITDGSRVVMGGDSAGVSDLRLNVRADLKVFRRGAFVIGFTSSFRMGQLLRYKIALPEPSGDPEEFMVVHFVEACRTGFSEAGFAKKSSEEEFGGTFLVGWGGNLFSVHDDYQIARSAWPFAAVGCGSSIALGSLYGGEGRGLSLKDRVIGALEAAHAFSAGVRPPFEIVSTSAGVAHHDTYAGNGGGAP